MCSNDTIHRFLVMTKGACDCDIQKHSPTEEEGLGPGAHVQPQPPSQGYDMVQTPLGPQPIYIDSSGQGQQEEMRNQSVPPQLAVRRTEEIYQSPATAATPAPNTGNPAALMQDHEEDSALQPDPKTPWGQQAQAQRRTLKPTDEDEAKEAVKALVNICASTTIKSFEDRIHLAEEMDSVLSEVFNANTNPPSKISATPGQSGSSGVYHPGTKSYHPHSHGSNSISCDLCGPLTLQKGASIKSAVDSGKSIEQLVKETGASETEIINAYEFDKMREMQRARDIAKGPYSIEGMEWSRRTLQALPELRKEVAESCHSWQGNTATCDVRPQLSSSSRSKILP